MHRPSRSLTGLAILLVTTTAEACWTVPIQTIVRVVDGDTFDARLAIWHGLEVTERIRVLDIDTPELSSRDPTTREMARKALEFTRAWLADSSGITLWTCRRDSFGRILARIYRSKAPTVLADALLAAGLGQAR